jgi:hypothetical protein
MVPRPGPATAWADERRKGGVSTTRFSDDFSALEAEQRRLSLRLAGLRDAIGLLERPGALRPDAAARLAMYRRNEQKLTAEMQALEWELAHVGPVTANGTSDLSADLLRQLEADRAGERNG